MALGLREWRGWEMARISAHLNYDAQMLNLESRNR